MFDDALALVDVHVVSYLQSYRPRIMGRYERLNFAALTVYECDIFFRFKKDELVWLEEELDLPQDLDLPPEEVGGNKYLDLKLLLFSSSAFLTAKPWHELYLSGCSTDTSSIIILYPIPLKTQTCINARGFHTMQYG